jgi:signal transduction histidine kinase
MITSNAPGGPAEKPINILHLEDSEVDHQLVCRTLDKAALAYTIARVDTLTAFIQEAASAQVDLILADYRLSGFTALDAWAALPAAENRPPFVLLSGAIGEAAAVSAIQSGISDYLRKEDLARLELVIRRAMEVHHTRIAKEMADRELAASERRLAEFAEHLQSAIERERAAIAREIHDDIGGSLAAVKLDLAWLARHSEDGAHLAHLQTASEMLAQAMGASQRIMMDLRPAILDQGLFAAVQWLTASFERRTGIKVEFHANNEKLAPPKAVGLTAYRTAQEALTNASKYARCDMVRLELSDAEGVLTLEITDNGVGMTRQEVEKPQAFGLRGLKERARTVGGWLDVSSRAGQGTSVILSVPLDPARLAGLEGQFL